MAADKFVVIPQHMYIRDQPHAAQILLDNSIKHKKPHLLCLNHLRPLNESTRTITTSSAIDTTVNDQTPEPPIVAKAEKNAQKEALLLTEDDDDDDEEGNEMEKNAEFSEAFSTERNRLQLELLDEHKLKRAKKVFEVIKKSERVKVYKDNEEIYIDKVPTGLKASVFLYDIQQQARKLYNPAFILILRSLKLDKQLVMNKYAKVAVHSTNTEQAQQKQRSRGSTNAPLISTALFSPRTPSSTSSSSKSSKRRKIRRTVTDSERERTAQKTKREEGAAEEDSESYETPDNDSYSATPEKTKIKAKNWQDYTS